MRKIGLLGGTFNPIHNGHLILATEALEQANLDEVWLIPSGISYMKEDQIIPEGKIRFHMAQLAVLGQQKLLVKDIEIKREGNTYTADTLVQLKEKFPDDHFYFIVGGDTLAAIPTWYHPEIIMKNCFILAGIRDFNDKDKLRRDADVLTQAYGGEVLFLSFPNIQISSSEIREKVIMGRSIHYLVPDAVEEYIFQEKIYGSFGSIKK